LCAVPTTPAALAARIAHWALPEGAILAAVVVAPRVLAAPEPLGSVATFSAYAALAAGLFLGFRFRRPRLLLSLLVLTLAALRLPELPPPFSVGERIALQAVGVLLPLNLAAIALLPERGLFTRAGLVRLGIILGQAALVMAAVNAAPRAVAVALEARFLPGALTAWTPLGQPALAAFALAAVACGGAQLFESGQGGRAGLWALIAAALAVTSPPGSAVRTLSFAAAGLILVAAVIESSFFLAYRDVLTGLPARRALVDALERLAGHYTIAMVDVDHFKQVNDRFGHDVGDQVLRLVAGRLAGVENGGTAYRYGGEEFAIVFPGKSIADVQAELERVRQMIADASFRVRRLDRPRRKPSKVRRRSARAELAVTVSIGAAEAGGRGKPDDVIRTADRALYKAKEGGRNRVEVS
jgi:diguanylate cyclase (GGDEF)-like protein